MKKGVKGVVLASKDYKEKDILITLFTITGCGKNSNNL